MLRIRWAVVAAALMIPALAGAEPVVQAGGKPGAAKSWTVKGTAVTLVLAEGYSAADVAEAIQRGVQGTTAKAQGEGKVVVTGLGKDELLAALEKVDVAAPLDDVNQMFATLQGVGAAEGEGSGSSIRATKAAELPTVVKDKEAEVPGTIVAVKHGTYPFVAVTIKIDQAPKSGAEIGLVRGAKITVVPRINAPKGLISPGDEQSKMNVAAWYSKPGDKVTLRLEGKSKHGFWVAERFERLPR